MAESFFHFSRQLPKSSQIAEPPSWLTKGNKADPSSRTKMKTNTRFIQSITQATHDSKIVMPWARGARRARFIENRTLTQKPTRKTG
ncbi:hypothetical protein ACVC7O_05810 [Roseobacter sp. A03A-229]